MAKASLKFHLPEDDDDFAVAVAAPRLIAALHEYAEYLRQQIKYHDKYELEPVRDEFYSILRDNRVDDLV